MPKMKMTAEKMSNELVSNVLYLFSVVAENIQLQPVTQKVGNSDHKMMNMIPRSSK